MIALFIGVVAASVFGIIATLLLGQEGLLTNAWVDVVFWSLIGAGAAVSLINTAWESLPCRVSKLTRSRSLIDRLCRHVPCRH